MIKSGLLSFLFLFSGHVFHLNISARDIEKIHPGDFPELKSKPYFEATMRAVNKYNELSQSGYSPESIERTRKFLNELTDLVQQKINQESNSKEVIVAIAQAQQARGNICYVADATLLQTASDDKIALDCNTQTATYILVLEELHSRGYTGIQMESVGAMSTFTHGFLRFEDAGQPYYAEVSDPQKFQIFPVGQAPVLYENAVALSTNEFEGDLLMDFSADVSTGGEAIAILKAAEVLSPNSINIPYNLAITYEKILEREEAFEAMDRAVAVAEARVTEARARQEPTFGLEVVGRDSVRVYDSSQDFSNLYVRRAILRVNAERLFSSPLRFASFSLGEDSSELTQEELDKRMADTDISGKFAERLEALKARAERRGGELERALLRVQRKETIDLVLADFQRAIDANPFYIDAYLNRGTFYALIGEYEKAIEDHARAEELLEQMLRDQIRNEGMDQSNNPFGGNVNAFTPNGGGSLDPTSSSNLRQHPADVLAKYNRSKDISNRLRDRILGAASAEGLNVGLELSTRLFNSFRTSNDDSLLKLRQLDPIEEARLKAELERLAAIVSLGQQESDSESGIYGGMYYSLPDLENDNLDPEQQVNTHYLNIYQFHIEKELPHKKKLFEFIDDLKSNLLMHQQKLCN